MKVFLHSCGIPAVILPVTCRPFQLMSTFFKAHLRDPESNRGLSKHYCRSFPETCRTDDRQCVFRPRERKARGQKHHFEESRQNGTEITVSVGYSKHRIQMRLM